MCRSLLRAGIAFPIFVSLAAASTGAQAATWQLTDLHFGQGSSIENINNRGQIVGNVDGTYVYDTFFYSNGTLSRIGHLQTDSPEPYSYGVRLNDAGRATGTSSYGDGGEAGFTYHNGALSKVGGNITRAVDINNAGQIVGTEVAAAGGTHSYLLNNGVQTDLGSLGGATFASALNDTAQVVGVAKLADDSSVMFLYEQGQMSSLGNLGGQYIAPTEINNKGQIIGTKFQAEIGPWGETVSFLYDHGVVTDFRALSGIANFTVRGINDLGQVVGNSLDGTAYLYSQGKFTDLSQYGIRNVADINDLGVIAGYSIASGNVALLDVSAVPEPAGYAMLLLGMGLLYGRRRRA